MANLALENINKVYENGFHAVHDLTLDVEDGEFLVLVGPSGCGKSTALRMVAGLESISSGTLSISDRVVNDVHPKDRDIAMVFQNYALYPHMTVAENMGFALKIAGVGKEERAARVLEACEHPQRGRLAAAGGADEDEELAVLDVEVETVHRGALGARVDPGGVVEGNCCHGVSPLPAGTCRTIRSERCQKCRR